MVKSSPDFFYIWCSLERSYQIFYAHCQKLSTTYLSCWFQSNVFAFSLIRSLIFQLTLSNSDWTFWNQEERGGRVPCFACNFRLKYKAFIQPYSRTLVTRIDNPWLLLATLPLYHPVQDLKMTPLLQFTPVHFVKSTPLPLLTTVCNFEALLGASLISMNQQVLLRPGTPVHNAKCVPTSVI